MKKGGTERRVQGAGRDLGKGDEDPAYLDVVPTGADGGVGQAQLQRRHLDLGVAVHIRGQHALVHADDEVADQDLSVSGRGEDAKAGGT